MGCQQSLPVEKEVKKPLSRMVIGGFEHNNIGSPFLDVKSKQFQSNGTANTIHSDGSKSMKSCRIGEDGTLVREDVEAHSKRSKGTKAIQHNDLILRYAWASRKGFDIEDADKPMQDEVSVRLKFAKSELDYFFAIYDGHGAHGHSCSSFVKSCLADDIATHVRRKRYEAYKEMAEEYGLAFTDDPTTWPSLTVSQFEEAVLSGYQDSSASLTRNKQVNDKYSGTSAVTLNFHDNHFIVSNIGQCRAVLGICDSENQKALNTELKFTAVPLSEDHTPYREDERRRVEELGTRIFCLEQLDKGLTEEDMKRREYVSCIICKGDEKKRQLELKAEKLQDPLRLWSCNGEYPGTSFTRSLGDRIAKEVGVIDEPEVIVKELNPHHRMIVLGSHGVFSFLSNQEVINIFGKIGNPQDAALAIVDKSYDLMLQNAYEAEDLSVLCITIDYPEGGLSILKNDDFFSSR